MKGAVDDPELWKLFKSSRETFTKVTDFALRVSEKLHGEPASRAGNLASIIHAKMTVNAVSVERLAEKPGLFDHSGIMALCRMIFEAMTLYYYLQETVSAEEWECRYLVLRLHDTVSRIKLMRTHEGHNYDDLKAGRDSLKQELRANAHFKTLLMEQQERLLGGEQYFVGGMRRAAETAGWNADVFTGYYNYFSVHSHGAPMSFMRIEAQEIDFAVPRPGQLAVVLFAMNVAEFCLLRASMHILATSVSGSRASIRPNFKSTGTSS
jgi:hypothetical protein